MKEKHGSRKTVGMAARSLAQKGFKVVNSPIKKSASRYVFAGSFKIRISTHPIPGQSLRTIGRHKPHVNVVVSEGMEMRVFFADLLNRVKQAAHNNSKAFCEEDIAEINRLMAAIKALCQDAQPCAAKTE